MAEDKLQFHDTDVVRASKEPVLILGLNSGRLQAMLYNDSPFLLKIYFGKPDKKSVHALTMMPNDYFELPTIWMEDHPSVFRGEIYGSWNGEKGVCRVTEFT